MMEDLINVIEELKRIRGQTSLKNWSDDSLADCATKIFNTLIINQKSFQNLTQGKKLEERPKVRDPESSITPEQIKFLKRRSMTERLKGINIEKLTKGEAYQLIKEIKEKKTKEDEKEEDYSDY